MYQIYVITNTITGERYVGQTETSIEKRWLRHIRTFKKGKYKNSKLYIAFDKYGIENFDYNFICETDKPNESEIFWIEKLDTFNSGYNSTRGGGCNRDLMKKKEYPIDQIIINYLKYRNINKVSRMMNISNKTISRILKSKNVEIDAAGDVSKYNARYSLAMIDTAKNKIVQVFNTQYLACKYIKQNFNVSATDGNIIHNIKKCLDGKRNTAYSHKWVYF